MSMTRKPIRRSPGTTAAILVLVTALASGCSSGPTPDLEALSARAVTLFQDCFARNDVQAENVKVDVSADGHVRTLSAQIVAEGDVPFEPQVRLACTQEVEARLADS
ncbi:MAG: hypothetical protein WB239_18000 [Acidimicrobiia bacterium]